MADYYTQGAVKNDIPCQYIKDDEARKLEAFGFTLQKVDGVYKVGSLRLVFTAEFGGETLGEEDMKRIFQGIIKRSGGTFPFVELEVAFTASDPVQGGFGGAAYFITADSVDMTSTESWLNRKRYEAFGGSSL